METHSEQYEKAKHDELENESRFEEFLADFLLGGRSVTVCDFGGAVSVQSLNNGGQGGKGCEDTACGYVNMSF
jgi:hypothetical protein